MKRILTRLLTTIGAIVVVYAVIIGVTLFTAQRTVPTHSLLELDLRESVVEYVPDDPLARLLNRRALRVRDVLDALELAADDERVVGLVARVGGQHGLGVVQELRDAVTAFRASGKPTVAWADTFGEFGPANGAYYLATAFDEIHLQPSGDLGLTGLVAETPFLRGTLDKIGVAPRLSQRWEYKNAANVFEQKGYTPAHREATEAVMRSQFGQIVRGIAERRQLPEEKVRTLMDEAPLSATEAREAELVDVLDYRDEVYAKFEERIGEEPTRLDALDYLARADSRTDGPVLALVYGVGGVRRGRSQYDATRDEVTMGGDTVAAALRDAAEDEDVRAIVFRIDSPGGSYVASDSIWRAVALARDAGKPVIATMGNVAGSGGYFVAMGADRIVAQPGTVTGSIGVLGGKMVTTGLWDWLGVSYDEVHTSQNSLMWTDTRDYSPSENAELQSALDRIYADFTEKAAAGRRLPLPELERVAKGRIWSGEDALARGLVDELGGFPAAIRAAKEKAGIDAEEDVELREFPRAKTLVETLLARARGEQDDREPVALETALAHVGSVIRRLEAVGLLPTEGALRMPASLGRLD
jgi:protease-4